MQKSDERLHICYKIAIDKKVYMDPHVLGVYAKRRGVGHVKIKKAEREENIQFEEEGIYYIFVILNLWKEIQDPGVRSLCERKKNMQLLQVGMH